MTSGPAAAEGRGTAPRRCGLRAAGPAFLLTSADHYGTLAAVRCVGRAGVPVTVADPKRLAPASFSRWATRRETCPPARDAPAFLAWLLAFAARSAEHVLYPTNDDHAFVLALHRDVLAPRYHVAFPGIDVVYPLLDKSRLLALCEAAGVRMPRTVAPVDEVDAVRLARDLRYPVVVKPRTQALHFGHWKGVLVSEPARLGRAYRDFVRGSRYGDALLAHDASAARPLVQEYHAEAVRGVYSVSGFVPSDGGAPAFRAATKVLQVPRRLGNGAVFEHSEVDAEIAARLTALIRRAGYHGVFEAEFIRCGEGDLLIDFNPRFFGQLGFDVARGLPSPLLVYWDALGDRAAIRAALARAEEGDGRFATAYRHALELNLVVAAQRALGTMSAEETRGWRTFFDAREGRIVDAVVDPSDLLPPLLDALQHALLYARHPTELVRLAKGE